MSPRPTVMTREQALKARELYVKNNVGIKMLAERYGVVRQVISEILRGQHVLTADLPSVHKSFPDPPKGE